MNTRITLRGVALAVASALLAACGPSNGGAPPSPPPVEVRVIEVQPTHAEVVRTYGGRVHSPQAVEVRARVGGVLEQRYYTEGAAVERGERLFRIDPQPFEVARRQAEADRQRAHAELRQTEREWDRARGLYGDNAISARERDQAESMFELAQAALATAEARLAAAELDLGYTEVVAPADGQTGQEEQPEGSLVSAGDLLTRITRLDPLQVRFAVPERERAELVEAVRRDGADAVSVRLVLPTDAEPLEGRLEFVESTVDAQTGSVRARAQFANRDGRLVPGQFVRLGVTVQTLDDALVVPQRALADGPVPGTVQLMIVDADDRVEVRTIVPGPVVADGQVVLEGLSVGERVIVEGTGTVAPGQEVRTRVLQQEQP